MIAPLFLFRQKLYCCDAIIDDTQEPYFIFCVLNDRALIEEFGEEITIKTDFKSSLPRKDDYPELVALRAAIFHAIKNTHEFQSSVLEQRLPK